MTAHEFSLAVEALRKQAVYTPDGWAVTMRAIYASGLNPRDLLELGWRAHASGDAMAREAK